MTTTADVHAAAARIAGHIRVTPVTEADPGTFLPAGRVWLKLEQLQHTGTFKARGALNRILSAAEQGVIPAAGVVAASGGNAGIAVAYAAARQKVPARVYVPLAVPEVKVARLRHYGAEVVRSGSRYAESYEEALKHAADVGALFCHPYDQPEICAGQGTLGLELLDDAERDSREHRAPGSRQRRGDRGDAHFGEPVPDHPRRLEVDAAARRQPVGDAHPVAHPEGAVVLRVQ